MATISVLVNARTKSTRMPRKLVRPFADTTLIEIALEKLNEMDFFAHRYYGVAEEELKVIGRKYENIELLERKPEAVEPGYNKHEIIYEHYGWVDSDYIFWLNPCHPLLSVETVRKAVELVLETKHNSYTSVNETKDWIFDDMGQQITNTNSSVLSTNHSQKYFKVAHSFHVIRKEYFLATKQYWTLTKNDPYLIEIPEIEKTDVDTPFEFEIAEIIYQRIKEGGRENKLS